MQTIIYMIAKSNQKSLREIFVNDLEKYDVDDIFIASKRKKGRNEGWSKLKRKNTKGSMNITWDASSKTLLCRAVSKSGNHPNELVAAFLSYVLRWQRKRIDSIMIRTIE